MAGDLKYRTRVDLAPQFIRSLKPKNRVYEVPDSRVIGLRAVVYVSGAVSFAIRYEMGDGRARKYTLGPYPRLKASDARKIAAKLLRDVHAGRDPGVIKTEKKKAAKAGTVADAFKIFESEHLTKKRSGKETKRIFERYILPRIGKRPLAIVTKTDVIEILKAVTAPAMSNRTYSALSKFWRFVAARDMVARSPMIGVHKLHEEGKGRDRLLTDVEVRIFWQATAKLQFPWRQLYRMLLLTGMRLNEAAKLPRDAIDWSQRLINIEGSRTKNSVPRAIYITKLLKAVLEEAPIGSDFMFGSPKRNVAPSGFSKAKKALDTKMNEISIGAFEGPIAPFVIHDLRRVVRSSAPRLSISDATAEKMIGHVSGTFRGVGGTYNRHQYIAETQAGFEKWADHIAKIVG